MSDFTKEELEGMLHWRTHVCDNDTCVKLRLKLQSMIDNYCEHLWSDGSGDLIMCVKCQLHGKKR